MAKALRLVPAVVEDGEGQEHLAQAAECPCGGQAFAVYQVEAQLHLHFQCLACDVTYCPKGACNA